MTTVSGFKTEKASVLIRMYDKARETGLMKIHRITDDDTWIFIVSSVFSWNPLIFSIVIALPILIFMPAVYLLIPLGFYLGIRLLLSGYMIYVVAHVAMRHVYKYRGMISYISADDCASILLEKASHDKI